MIVDVIVNRSSLTITNPSEIKSNTSTLLVAGSQKITFDSAYSDADYDLVIEVYDANGVRSGYTLGTLEADGFNITLSYDSIVKYIANKT